MTEHTHAWRERYEQSQRIASLDLLAHHLDISREALRLATLQVRLASDELQQAIARDARREAFTRFWVAQRAMRLCKQAVRQHQGNRA